MYKIYVCYQFVTKLKQCDKYWFWQDIDQYHILNLVYLITHKNWHPYVPFV